MPCLTKSGRLPSERLSVQARDVSQNSSRAPSLETSLTRSRTMKQHINSSAPNQIMLTRIPNDMHQRVLHLFLSACIFAVSAKIATVRVNTD